jgi:hypothetical protein
MGRLQTLAEAAIGPLSRMRSVVATALPATPKRREGGCRRVFRERRPERLDTARRLQYLRSLTQ